MWSSSSSGEDLFLTGEIATEQVPWRAVLDVGLDGAAQMAGPVGRVEPLLDEPLLRFVVEAHEKFFSADLGVELADLEVDDLPDVVLREGVEDDGLVDAVDELRVEVF